MKTASFEQACNRAVCYANRHGRKLERAESFLQRAGWITFGIEYVSCAERELAYVNTGDTYRCTVAKEGRGGVFVTSWGDWYEGAEREHCEENDLISCGYCGEFTPVAAQWDETVCEHCGRNVSTGER